jgi:hypothetical protein
MDTKNTTADGRMPQAVLLFLNEYENFILAIVSDEHMQDCGRPHAAASGRMPQLLAAKMQYTDALY